MDTEQLEELLETIRTSAGLDYISDLHSGRHNARLVSALRALIPDRYDAEAWRGAASYILSRDVGSGDARSLRQSLLDALK